MLVIGERKRSQIHTVTKGSERKISRDGKNMENPKKGKCHIPRERRERGREEEKISQTGNGDGSVQVRQGPQAGGIVKFRKQM